MPKKTNKISGFAAPLGSRGKHALYGPPPWHFEGWSASAVLRIDAQEVQGIIPEPLKLAGEPTCRLSLHDIICDNGFGREYAQLNPDQAHFHEAIIGFLVEHEGIVGQWCPYSWCSSDAEFAVGREFYGWPQKLGTMSLTRQPLDGWKIGDHVTALVARGQRAVFDMSIRLDRQDDIPAIKDGHVYPNQARAGNYFTETVLPLPSLPMSVERRIVATQMQDLRVMNIWSGTAQIEVSTPELDFLKNAEVLGGRWHEISWTKPFPNSIVSCQQVELE